MNAQAYPRPRHASEPDKSATEFGIFGPFAEIFFASMLLAIGVHFLIVASEPDLVAWVAFGLIAVLLIDSGRRLYNISTGKSLR